LKICRFGLDRIGEIDGETVFDITSLVDRIASQRSVRTDPIISALPDLLITPAADRRVGAQHRLASIALQAPITAPGKIIAAPVNYRAHIEEAEADPGVRFGHHITDIQEAGLFLKATSALAGPDRRLAIRFPDRRTDFEIELVAVIGSPGSNIAEKDALWHLAGYTVGLDITLRGPEDRSFRKSIDGYAIVGPWLTTVDEIVDPNNLRLTLEQNGEVRQDANTADMVFDVARLISFASSFYTLDAGDILFTGTPQGVGPIRSGDVLVASIESIGSMSVTVA
jgi:2,4-diketo-3-deoxy-L-fuconate hydrolase